MSHSARMLSGTRTRIAIVGIVAAGLAVGGFQVGRQSVDAAALSMRAAEAWVDSPSIPPRSGAIATSDYGDPRISEIAIVPFSELYDVLRSASREQLLAWARDLEQMPRGPRQRAAVAAYYKSLIQVDHHAAIEALFRAENLNMRDLAIDALLKAAPESIWGELAETMEQLPYPGRGYSQEDLILKWSRVDPVATSQFIEKHPSHREDRRLPSLLCNWGEIDPTAARNWLEADASRQTKDALQAFVTSWGRADRAGAIDYAVANAHEAKFEGAINELVYQFVRSAKEDGTRLIVLLPPERAKAAVKNMADITNPKEINPNLDRPSDYQRPPEEVARWMVGLPAEFWNESIGKVAQEWLNQDALSATNWFDQLPANSRDAAITSFCRVAGGSSAEHVMTLALRISDRGVRDMVLGEYARRLGDEWRSSEEAISELPISDQDKAYLRSVMAEGEKNGR